MHDPRTGALLGIVDVSGPALTLHPAIAALVGTAVRFQESQLLRYQQEGLERLRAAAGPLMASIDGPLMLVDYDGWVAHAAGVPPRPRIAAPRQDRPIAVPGLGLCLPERVANGWLVRPSSVRETRIAVTLDLAASPYVEVSGGEHQWRRSLTARHAEILELLHHAGPTGLSAAELSRRLHGDSQHVVAVRAEVSRMRRTLGGIVDSRPYRLSPSVEITIHRAYQGATTATPC